MRVTVTQQIDTFFLKIFGTSGFDISRTAVPEYVQPLSLGSPESDFGDDPADEISPGLVAKVDGFYIGTVGGEHFGSLCLNDGFGADCLEEVYCGGGPASRALNPEGRQASNWDTSATGGYLYAIEVEEGSSAGFAVEIFSGPVYAVLKYKGSAAPPTGTGNFHGDNKQPKSQCGGDKCNVEARTWFMLYRPDPTPSDTTDGNELLCSVAYDERMPTTAVAEYVLPLASVARFPTSATTPPPETSRASAPTSPAPTRPRRAVTSTRRPVSTTSSTTRARLILNGAHHRGGGRPMPGTAMSTASR